MAGTWQHGDLGEPLRAARSGDLDAFNLLVHHFQRQVYNICLRMLGNPEDAADASQDAFLSAYRHIRDFQGPGSGFQAWLLRIAINQCYDQLRRRQRRPTMSVDRLAQRRGEHLDSEDFFQDPRPGPEPMLLGAETAQRIQQGLDSLHPDQRLTVVLCDVQGLSYEEAAAAMGVELGTVKSRLSRARARLRDYLLALGELPAAHQRSESGRDLG